MKEVHAYQNDDGTYRVEIVDIVKTSRTIGREIYESTTESRTEIPRATIQITAYKSKNPSGEILIFTVEG